MRVPAVPAALDDIADGASDPLAPTSQEDKPFKRSLQPFGGIRMAETSCESYGYKVDDEVVDIFTKYRKTHNQGVF